MLWADYFLHDDGGPKQKTSEMFQKKYKKEIKVG
jgi:hypothetical protein